MRIFLLSFFFLSLLVPFKSDARDIPNLSGPVMDQVGVIPYQLKRKLAASLKQFKKVYGPEIQLFVIDKLGAGETIESYSIKVVDRWQLGGKEKDNGVLFLISMNDRKMRIEVGQGLEGNLTDLESGRIIRLVRPYFKQKDFPTGILVGLQAIATNLGGELTSVPLRSPRRKNPKHGTGYYIFLLIIVLFFGRGGRGGLGWFVLGSLSSGSRRSSSNFSGGYSGGSSWGGGGGGFSGGGASGDW